MVDGILIGGSPSTGSSVLVNMLNRHPDVVAGPETYLFIHPKLYTEWPAYRWFLLHRSKWGGLKSIGWFRKNGADLLDPFYGWTQESLSAEIPQALDLPAFAEAFFSKSRKGKDASRWVEKSPSNALCLDLFLHHFPGGRVVHTTRNPYDTIASLVSRGLSPFEATAAYLLNTSFALKAAGSARYFCLKYEDWVHAPDQFLRACFAHLGLNWDPSCLEPEKGATEVRMEGWLHNEKGPLQAGSVGRFQRLPALEQEKICYAVEHLRIDPRYREIHQLPVSNIPEICEILEYPIHPSTRSFRLSMTISKWRNQAIRQFKWYPHPSLFTLHSSHFTPHTSLFS
ncbi:MAG: sulfotransferase [Saprospirales bacterium]|nr:sulfotransferase [Saprospirales bacterium]